MTEVFSNAQSIAQMAIDQSKTLSQFRRHPDWGKALARVSTRHPDLFVVLTDGRKAIADENTSRLVDLADQEFIDEIIRGGN